MDENIARFLRQSAAHLGIRAGFFRNAVGFERVQRTLSEWRGNEPGSRSSSDGHRVAVLHARLA